MDWLSQHVVGKGQSNVIHNTNFNTKTKEESVNLVCYDLTNLTDQKCQNYCRISGHNPSKTEKEIFAV